MHNRTAINPSLLDEVLRRIVHAFTIVYADFKEEAYHAYRERGIVGFVRFDEGLIFFDRNLTPDEENRTWAHEVLSVYYYWLVGIIRHDDEVEREARRLCQDADCLAILRRYQAEAKGRGSSEMSRSRRAPRH